MTPPFHKRVEGGLRVTVRVIPNARQDALQGRETRADGQQLLKVRVTAVPEKGRANIAVIALIARLVGCPKSAITLESGATASTKTLLIRGEPDAIAATLEALVQ